jgi:hypothetical protein
MQPDHLPRLGPGRNTIKTKFAVYDITFHAIGLNLLRRSTTKGQMLQRADATPAARPKTSSKKHMKALTMKFDPPDTSLKNYKKRRSAFLNELIASTPNVSARAKEFRRWIDENSPYSDTHEA